MLRYPGTGSWCSALRRSFAGTRRCLRRHFGALGAVGSGVCVSFEVGGI